MFGFFASGIVFVAGLGSGGGEPQAGTLGRAVAVFSAADLNHDGKLSPAGTDTAGFRGDLRVGGRGPGRLLVARRVPPLLQEATRRDATAGRRGPRRGGDEDPRPEAGRGRRSVEEAEVRDVGEVRRRELREPALRGDPFRGRGEVRGGPREPRGLPAAAEPRRAQRKSCIAQFGGSFRLVAGSHARRDRQGRETLRAGTGREGRLPGAARSLHRGADSPSREAGGGPQDPSGRRMHRDRGREHVGNREADSGAAASDRGASDVRTAFDDPRTDRPGREPAAGRTAAAAACAETAAPPASAAAGDRSLRALEAVSA